MSGACLRAGLIGEHIQKTRLPAALALMADAVGITLEFELIDTALEPDFDFVGKVHDCMNAGWTGVTVTHPYKIDARSLAGNGMIDEIKHLKAANTLTFGKTICAFNTDYSGFIEAWHSNMPNTKPGKVAMAGAGGVASALGPALVKLGASEIAIWDIDSNRAETLAYEIGTVAKVVDADQIAQSIVEADGLVNATAVGMEQYPGSAIDPKLLGTQSWAFDAVYTPSNTEFLSAAACAGLSTMSGFELFRHMALGSFEAYTGISLARVDMLRQLQSLRPA